LNWIKIDGNTNKHFRQIQTNSNKHIKKGAG
jgi:hypothetical protein